MIAAAFHGEDAAINKVRARLFLAILSRREKFKLDFHASSMVCARVEDIMQRRCLVSMSQEVQKITDEEFLADNLARTEENICSTMEVYKENAAKSFQSCKHMIEDSKDNRAYIESMRKNVEGWRKSELVSKIRERKMIEKELEKTKEQLKDLEVSLSSYEKPDHGSECFEIDSSEIRQVMLIM